MSSKAKLFKLIAMLQEYESPFRVSNGFERSLAFSPNISGIFLLNPFPNIRRTVLQLDAIPFAIRQELHGLSIHQRDVFQIQGQIGGGQLEIEQALQLPDVFGFDSAAEGEDDLSIRGSFDLQHRGLSDAMSFR